MLIVDDDSATLRVLDLAFRKRGYEPRLAASGPEGLQLLAREKADIIIADIIMPEMDGFEFFRRVRGEKDLASIPFIFLSGDRTSKSKVRGLGMGVDDYITKPCVLTELLAKVQSILKKAGAAGSLAAGNWDLSGRLTAMPMEEVIQILEMSKKTGRLCVTSKYGEADLFFDGGQIGHAQFGDLEGEEVVFLLFAWMAGEFHFRAGEKAGRTTVTSKCAGLLLEGLRQKDERLAILGRREKATVQTVGAPLPPGNAPRRQATTIQAKAPRQAPAGTQAEPPVPPRQRRTIRVKQQKNAKRIAGGPPPRRRRG